MTLTHITIKGASSKVTGTSKFNKDDVTIAPPKSLLAGYCVAKKPPGTCVIKYPQNMEESMFFKLSSVYTIWKYTYLL